MVRVAVFLAVAHMEHIVVSPREKSGTRETFPGIEYLEETIQLGRNLSNISIIRTDNLSKCRLIFQ